MWTSLATIISGMGPLGVPELIIMFVLFVVVPGIIVAIVLGVISLSNRSARRKEPNAAPPAPPPLPATPPPHPKTPPAAPPSK